MTEALKKWVDEHPDQHFTQRGDEAEFWILAFCDEVEKGSADDFRLRYFEAKRELLGADSRAPEPTPCRIYEYDGAFKCYAHNRTWGAVTNPQEPCAGWEAER